MDLQQKVFESCSHVISDIMVVSHGQCFIIRTATNKKRAFVFLIYNGLLSFHMNFGDLLHFHKTKLCYFLHHITDENSAVCVMKSSFKMF